MTDCRQSTDRPEEISDFRQFSKLFRLSPRAFAGELRLVGCFFVILAVCSATTISGCTREPQRKNTLDGTRHEFAIHWPPIAPEVERARKKPPLLRGDVSISESITADQRRALKIAVTIRRPSDEEGRKFWNSQLAFSSVPWMDEVRVWDSEEKWQWPNLPYLLRRYGEERVERYGGVDPEKLVDNDFAALLIRKFDVEGKVESQDTFSSPLVSAEWRGNGEPDTDIHTVAHVANSDRFVVHVGGGDERAKGMLKLWLIYADFLGSLPPRSWPEEREWAGGILAYCEIVWEKVSGEPCLGTVRFLTPSRPTGFEWAEWSTDPSGPAQSRLTDISK